MTISEVRQKPRGRYDGGRDARLAPGGVARPLPSLAARTALGAVQNPERLNERNLAAIHTGVDVLEADLARGDISEAAYAMGRTLQAIWERADGARLGSTWVGEGGSGGDPREALIRRMAGVVGDAKVIVAIEAKIAAIIGTVGTRFLRRCLIGGKTYGALAAEMGKGGARGTSHVADRVRWLLEDLARSWHA